MATVVLQAVGGAIGGPLGGAIGGAIGSYIDSELIMPALFPPDDVVGQQIQELQIQSSDEGSPITRCYGGKTRVAGLIIWMPEKFNETRHVHEGGKGSDEPDQITYTYSVDLAIVWTQGPPDGNGIEEVARIYADGNLIYNEDSIVNISSDLLSCRVLEIRGQGRVNRDTGQDTSDIVDKTLVVDSPAAGPDLSQIIAGSTLVDMTGWTQSDYNTTGAEFRCVGSVKRSDGTSSCMFRLPVPDSSVGEAAGNTITIIQGNPNFDTRAVANVTNYLGTEAQTKDGFMTGLDGVGNVSGNRGLAYSVLEGFVITDYGNRVPNFTAEIHTKADDTLDDVIGDILQDTDLEASEYDVTALTSTAVKGYVLRGPLPTISALQPLNVCFDVVAQDLNGVLTFFLRQNASVVTIAEDDLFAHTENERDNPWPFKHDRKNQIEPPAEVLVKYIDEQNQLQPGEQRERRINAGINSEKKVVNVQVTFDGGEARDVAAKLLWTASTGRREHEIVVPPSYLHIVENDIVEYTYSGETFRFLVQDVTDGPNGTRVITGVDEVTAHMTHSSPHEPPRSFDQRLAAPYDCRLEPIDVGPLESQHVSQPGIYFGAISNQISAVWRGGLLYQSDDEGVTWTLQTLIPNEMIIGQANTALPAVLEGAHWDRSSVLEVTIDEDRTLANVTELQCLNGLNRAVVGSEVIGFQYATLAAVQPLDGVKYELTKLLRGLAGSERYMTEHFVNDRFCLLEREVALFKPFSTSDIGSYKNYVATANGGDPDDYLSRQVLINCENILPLHPVHLFGERNAPATNDWTVTWIRRARQYFRIFAQLAPSLDSPEDYIVDVRNALDNATVATYTSTLTANGSGVTGTTFVYDSADQVTDFGSVQSTIYIRVYQVSQLAGGRGKGTPTTSFTG